MKPKTCENPIRNAGFFIDASRSVRYFVFRAPQKGQVTTLPLDAFRAINWTDFERELGYSGILEMGGIVNDK
jgi:hypothetical protein